MSEEGGARFRPETLAVRAGYDPASAANAAKPPVYMTSTFAYASARQARDIHQAYFDGAGPEVGNPAHIYARLSHPNLDMVEARLAALDGAEGAAVFNSGMATHSAIALAHLRPGDSVVFSRPIYGGTNGLYTDLMPGFGIGHAEFADGCDRAAIEAAVDQALASGPLKLIVVETPANPTAAIVDIALVVSIADAVGQRAGVRPLVVVDNTLLGPLMQRPIELGADLCMTSLTKYCGGHSDLLAGGVSGREALVAPLRLLRTTLGSHLDPYTSWLMLRSMETVHLRVERAMANARTIAEFLRDHPKVASVTYLGFLAEGTPQRAVFDRQCRAAGSTFAFDLVGGEAEAFRFLDRLALLRFAVSLGGSETLITHPATTTHYAITPEERARGGIGDATLRLSVGIEHVDDLLADLAQALDGGLMARDVHAIDGKLGPVEERFDTVVVGAGAAGAAAAIAAAGAGASVLLLDENPVSGALMGADVPLFYGGRMTAAVQQPDRMLEQVFASNPALERAFEAGVDVRLGTTAWGLYVAGPALRALPEPMLGIADAGGASMIGFDRLVLATGARDIALGFAGWNQPGVMGAQGFAALLVRYGALASRRVVVVGADTLGLETALLALAHGVEVAAVVEIDEAAPGPDALHQAVRAAGVPILLGHSIATAHSGVDGVSGVTLASDDARRDIACDTICLAIGVMPATELIEAAGVAPGGPITLVGDCADARPPAADRLQRWAEALGRHAPADTIVCQCEEVTRTDLLGVQPPRYLDRPARMAARSLATLRADGPSHPDQIKRLTRAGMGACQGRRCREGVRCLLAAADGVPLDAVPIASFRAPVRPVPLNVLADWEERREMTAGWDVWFGIPTQWTPYAVIGTPEEAEHVAGLGGNMHV